MAIWNIAQGIISHFMFCVLIANGGELHDFDGGILWKGIVI
jgi:hypothetical protein